MGGSNSANAKAEAAVDVVQQIAHAKTHHAPVIEKKRAHAATPEKRDSSTVQAFRAEKPKRTAKPSQPVQGFPDIIPPKEQTPPRKKKSKKANKKSKRFVLKQKGFMTKDLPPLPAVAFKPKPAKKKQQERAPQLPKTSATPSKASPSVEGKRQSPTQSRKCAKFKEMAKIVTMIEQDEDEDEDEDNDSPMRSLSGQREKPGAKVRSSPVKKSQKAADAFRTYNSNNQNTTQSSSRDRSRKAKTPTSSSSALTWKQRDALARKHQATGFDNAKFRVTNNVHEPSRLLSRNQQQQQQQNEAKSVRSPSPAISKLTSPETEFDDSDEDLMDAILADF